MPQDKAGTEHTEDARDWSKTLFLPKTDFPMRAGLPKMEPNLLERWNKIDLYARLREAGKGRAKFVLHDGPPYANGNIHIGTGLNKILKDIVVKSQQMLGRDSNYVPGWDCHGLPIEWKVEEEYRSKGREKPDFSDPKAMQAFRTECREFAEHWLDVQREEFKRLGVVGDWDNPYTTMAYRAEAWIASELMKFAQNGLLYRGSKPVMWSVVEQTALAEAEVEYHDYESDTIFAKFPVTEGPDELAGTSIVIWTTTPWTMPGNRAICYSDKLDYGLYEVTEAPDGNWAAPGDKIVLAGALVDSVMKSAKVEAYERRADVTGEMLAAVTCAHPLRAADLGGYQFDVPLLSGDHVTDEAGTGFVHTAPGHGREDFEAWMERGRELSDRGIDTAIPFTVGADGKFTSDAPGFEGGEVITEKGKKGNANKLVIDALVKENALIARGRLKHQYPHSWRSKKPVIFRNTPQWFVYMDHTFKTERSSNQTLRDAALQAISETEFVPKSGQNRLRGMIEARPDWVLSRQRAWGVPITVFVHSETAEVIPSATFKHTEELSKRISDAIGTEGADAWFAAGARERFLDGLVDNPTDWEQVTDILDVWFDSGSTHAFTMEDPEAFPGLTGINRTVDGGSDTVMYLEGSDQHRGWFHSSLLESCGTRGRAPYDIVLTHGFVLDEKGQKMSKSLGNTTAPQDVIKQMGADILRLWVASSDYSDDLRIGPEILKTFVETYRKLRNSMRWMLGALHHFDAGDAVAFDKLPPLERFMLHRLAELDSEIRDAYEKYEYRRVVSALSTFMNADLSAFYFDVRKDALYCEAHSSEKRLAALTVISEIFNRCTVWLAPILCFTAEESWICRHPSDNGSVHLEVLPETKTEWLDSSLANQFERVMRVRRVVTGALEVERREKRIGSSLEAAPVIHVVQDELRAAFDGLDVAEIMITSNATLTGDAAPSDAFTIPEVAGVAVVPALAVGQKCARSWRIVDDVGADPDFPDLSARDAAAVREFDAKGLAAAS
ncbi:MAG: isoleucine--tRNA ligase [Pseudomonadota bacterium]